MNTLYIDCGMGAAGDMLGAALLELTEDKQSALEQEKSKYEYEDLARLARENHCSLQHIKSKLPKGDD